MPTEANKTIVRRFVEGLNTGNLDIIEETVAPQYLNHHPLPGQRQGLAGLKELVTAFRRSFPDLTLATEEMVAEEDWVTQRVSWHGTHQGEFNGVAPTGTMATVSGLEMFHIEDGRITESWIHHDLLALLEQLGAVPTARVTAAISDVGYQDGYTTGAGAAATGEKPESKLWWNDGAWWGSLLDATSQQYRIFRLDRATQTWVNTGVLLDDRPKTRADTLWDGEYLYVASHVRASSNVNAAAGNPTRLYKFSYSSGSRTYSLEPGFPAQINDVSSETLTIDKDSTGILWATWTQGQVVYVNHTTGSDASWGTPFQLPVSGAIGLNADDISAVVAFGSKIGIMWSNQVNSTMWFAEHRAGDPPTTWEASRTVLSGPNQADDHISLRGDPAGRVFAVVKTSLDELGGGTSAPQILVLARDPSSGNWSSYVFGRVSDCHTRPILMLDPEHNVLHVFATAPLTGCPYSGYPGSIFEKTSSMDNISFPVGRGTAVMTDAASPNLNNATSSKQSVSSITGLVVLASNDSSQRYWHADLPLGDGTTAPTANFTAAPTTGPAPLSVSFTDASTGNPTSWGWDFGDGGTSTSQNPTHTYGTPGTYTVSLTATNAAGSDSVIRDSLIIVSTPSSVVTAGGSTSTAQPQNNTLVTLTKPPGTVAGDVLIASFTVDQTPTISSPPSGWTSFLPSLTPANGASLFAYYRVVTAGDDTTIDWTWTLSSPQKWGGGVTRYLGVDALQPLDTSVSTAVRSDGTATTITVPSVTTVTNGAMLIGGIGADGSTPTTTPPSGWTESWESTGGQVAEQAYASQTAAGGSGPQTWTISSGRAIAGWMTALRPS